LIEIVIATQNLDKFREITYILKGPGVKFSNLATLNMPPEIGNTLEENAIMKAEYGFKMTNRISIADDSGLEVESLNRLPGVYSARFAGIGATYKTNRDKLLLLLAGQPTENRGAKFRCVVAVTGIQNEPTKIFDAELNGYITEEDKGELGFGYDPIFFVPELGKTLAEIPSETKNQISHRAIAFLKVKHYIKNYM